MRKTALILAAGFIGLATPALAAPRCQNTGSFEKWVEQFKKDAAAQGISPKVIAAASPELTFDESVIKRDSGQAVFTRTFLDFSKRLLGGQRIARAGSFMQPTILAGIRPDNPAFSEEFFGPVALMFTVADEHAAVALANHSAYGLGGSVFTKDIARGKRVASQIDSGMVFINQPTWTSADLPFGGIKNSGYGRELSSLGIQEFVNKKLVRTSTAPAPA